MDRIFIPGNVPSSKNGKQWTGKHLIWSKAARDYVKTTQWEFVNQRKAFHALIKDIQPPYVIPLLFVRSTRHQFDYTGPKETIQDLMVKHGWIADDNSDVMLPLNVPYQYSKEKPGVWIGPVISMVDYTNALKALLPCLT